MKIFVDTGLTPVKSTEAKFITVFLTPQSKDKHNFRCMNCGKLLLQYEGEIIVITDNGDKPKESNALDIRCNRCEFMYKVIS